MHIATAEVNATLTTKAGATKAGATLTVHVVLSPDDNIAITTVTADPPMDLTVTTWVYAALESGQPPCNATPGHLTDPTAPKCSDSTVGAGVSGDAATWAQREPLGNSSSKPITVVIATTVLGSAAAEQNCSKVTDTAATCLVPAVSSLQVATVIRSNLDLCGEVEVATSTGSCDRDPLQPALAELLQALNTSSAADVAAANAQWWSDYWNATWVTLPTDPTIEQFYYVHSYLIGAASRAGSVAAGLWGPWVHSDNPGWAGDFTLGTVSFCI